MAWGGMSTEIMTRRGNTAKRHASRWERRAWCKESTKRVRRMEDREVIRQQTEEEN